MIITIYLGGKPSSRKRLMFNRFHKIASVSVVLILLIITCAVSVTPVQASVGTTSIPVSDLDYLNPDGTLNLQRDFSGAIDLKGWKVNIDLQKGPVFTRADQSSATIGDWESLGGGVPMSFNGQVLAVAVMNGNIIVGGAFTNLANNREMDYIASWNGVNWSALGNNGAGNGS